MRHSPLNLPHPSPRPCVSDTLQVLVKQARVYTLIELNLPRVQRRNRELHTSVRHKGERFGLLRYPGHRNTVLCFLDKALSRAVIPEDLCLSSSFSQKSWDPSEWGDTLPAVAFPRAPGSLMGPVLPSTAHGYHSDGGWGDVAASSGAA